MYFSSIESPQVEIPARAPPENKTLFVVIPYLIEQAKTFDRIWGLVPFAQAAPANFRLVDLPV